MCCCWINVYWSCVFVDVSDIIESVHGKCQDDNPESPDEVFFSLLHSVQIKTFSEREQNKLFY